MTLSFESLKEIAGTLQVDWDEALHDRECKAAVIIHADHSLHRKTQQPLGPAVMRHRYLSRENYMVLNIQEREWAELMSSEGDRAGMLALLEDKLKRCVQKAVTRLVQRHVYFEEKKSRKAEEQKMKENSDQILREKGIDVDGEEEENESTQVKSQAHQSNYDDENEMTLDHLATPGMSVQKSIYPMKTPLRVPRPASWNTKRPDVLPESPLADAFVERDANYKPSVTEASDFHFGKHSDGTFDPPIRAVSKAKRERKSKWRKRKMPEWDKFG